MCIHAMPFTHVDVTGAPDHPLQHDVVLCHIHTYVHLYHSSTVLLPVLSNPVDPLSLLPSSPSSPLFLPSPPLQGGKTKVAFPIVCEVPLPPTSGPPAGTIEREQVSTTPPLPHPPSSKAPQQPTCVVFPFTTHYQSVQYVWHVIRGAIDVLLPPAAALLAWLP